MNDQGSGRDSGRGVGGGHVGEAPTTYAPQALGQAPVDPSAGLGLIKALGHAALGLSILFGAEEEEDEAPRRKSSCCLGKRQSALSALRNRRR